MISFGPQPLADIFYTQILRFHRHQLNHSNNKTFGAVAITTAYLVEGKTYLFVEFVFMKESNHHVLIDPNWCPNLCPNLVQLSISLMEVLKQPTNPCHSFDLPQLSLLLLLSFRCASLLTNKGGGSETQGKGARRKKCLGD